MSSDRDMSVTTHLHENNKDPEQSPPTARTLFEVEGRRFDTKLCRLTFEGSALQMEPKMMAVMHCLASREGDLVSRAELFEEVWADTIVTDDVLTRSISRLRTMLGDDAAAQRVIETIPRRGYRLLASVSWITANSRTNRVPQTPPRRRPSKAMLIGTPAMAVLALGWAMLYGLDVGPAIPKSAPIRSYPVTSLLGFERMPSSSPDGQQVVFVGDQGEGTDLYVASLEGGDPIRLTSDGLPVRSPAWGPDGTTIAFIRHDSDNCSVVTLNVISHKEHQVAACNNGWRSSLDWAPGGSHLLMDDQPESGASTLYEIDVSSGERTVLTAQRGGSRGDSFARYSRDGGSVIFARKLGDGQSDLFELELSSANETRLTHDLLPVTGLDISQDNNHVFYSTVQSSSTSVWDLDRNARTRSWVPLSVSGYGIDIPRNGGNAVFEKSSSDMDVMMLSLSDRSGTPRTLVASTATERSPSLSPDGQHFTYLSDRSGDWQVWMSDIDGTNNRRLTDQENIQLLPAEWSPDGQNIVFTAFLSGQAELFILPGLDGPAVQLTDLPSHECNPSWSPDGKWIYFMSNRNASTDLYKIQVDGTELTRVTDNGGFFGRMSPYDDNFYYTKGGHGGFWRLAPDGSKETRVFDQPDSVDQSNWQVTESGVYWTERSSDASDELVFRDFLSNERRVIHADQLGGSFVVFPNQDTVLFTRVVRQNVDIYGFDLASDRE